MSGLHPRRRQRGMALIVTLILLVVATSISLASLQLGMGDFKIAGNMQHRAQTAAVAEQAIEEAVSSTRFFENPGAVYPAPCSDQNTFCSDVNGDGIDDVLVTLTPQPVCTEARQIRSSDLRLDEGEDIGCAVGVQQNFGMTGAVSDVSLCAKTTWQIRAEAVDDVAETRVAVTEGVSVTVAATDMASNCPSSEEDPGGGEEPNEDEEESTE